MSSQLQYLLIGACILGFAAMEFTTRRYQAAVRGNATANDTWLEVLMFVSLLAITQPIALLGSNALCNWLMAAQHNAWANLPWWAMAGLLLIGDDLTQYLWHRASHTPLLWPLHRAHHTAHYMSIRITYRNNFFYYLMMPGLWISGVLIYLGFGTVYPAYIVVKLAVILGAHSAVRGTSRSTASARCVRWPGSSSARSRRRRRTGRTTRSPTTTASATTRATSATCCSSGTCCSAPPRSRATIRPRSACPTTCCTARSAGSSQMFYPLVHSKREHSALRPGGYGFTEADLLTEAKQEAA